MKPEGNSYRHPITVQAGDIDDLNHVNNEVYLRWLLEAATAHSASLGFGLQEFLAQGGAFVVRRHELEYLLPAFLGDHLVVETWSEKFERSSAWRVYRILRDGKVLLTGRTLWVFVDLKTGRPIEIPEPVREAFRSAKT